MLFEYSLISTLTKKESAFVIEHLDKCKNLYECLYKLLHEHKLIERRKKIISGLLDSLQKPFLHQDFYQI